MFRENQRTPPCLSADAPEGADGTVSHLHVLLAVRLQGETYLPLVVAGRLEAVKQIGVSVRGL